MIALLSKGVRLAEGARWEIRCAVEESVPVLGVHISQDDRYTPPEIAGQNVIPWTWDGIATFLKQL